MTSTAAGGHKYGQPQTYCPEPSRILRTLLYLSFSIAGTGCALCTTEVSAIGLRFQSGNIMFPENTGTVAITDGKVYSPGLQYMTPGPTVTLIPYVSFESFSLTNKPLGDFGYIRNGDKFLVNINGDTKRFAIKPYKYVASSRPKGEVHIERMYREWYGYPAQTLQVLALPADAVLTATSLAAAAVVLPVWYVRSQFHHPQQKVTTPPAAKQPPQNGAK